MKCTICKKVVWNVATFLFNNEVCSVECDILRNSKIIEINRYLEKFYKPIEKTNKKFNGNYGFNDFDFNNDEN